MVVFMYILFVKVGSAEQGRDGRSLYRAFLTDSNCVGFVNANQPRYVSECLTHMVCGKAPARFAAS